jgi:hypothetical protein
MVCDGDVNSVLLGENLEFFSRVPKIKWYILFQKGLYLDRSPYLLFSMEAGSGSADKDVNLKPLLYLVNRQPLGIVGYVENG